MASTMPPNSPPASPPSAAEPDLLGGDVGQKRQRLVVALGGNALLKRGEPLTFANQVTPLTLSPSG